MNGNTPAMFLFGLRNNAKATRHLAAQRMTSRPMDTESVNTMNTEFVGMVDYMSVGSRTPTRGGGIGGLKLKTQTLEKFNY